MATFDDAYYKDPETGLFVPFPYIKQTSTLTTADEIVAKARENVVVDANYVHTDNNFTNAYKNDGDIGTGNPTFPTVKAMSEYLNSITYTPIASFSPVVGTTSFSSIYDNSGTLLSDRNIKKCVIELYAATTASAIQIGVLQLNGITTNTYKQTSNLSSGILFRHNAEAYVRYTLDFTGILKYTASGVHSSTVANDTTFAALTYIGINRTILNSKLTQLDLILGAGITFQANSIINIYVL